MRGHAMVLRPGERHVVLCRLTDEQCEVLEHVLKHERAGATLEQAIEWLIGERATRTAKQRNFEVSERREKRQSDIDFAALSA